MQWKFRRFTLLSTNDITASIFQIGRKKWKGHTVSNWVPKKDSSNFWERCTSMICLCSKYVKNFNIFGQILNIWVKSIQIYIYIYQFFFQCLALPKDPQSFGSQNLRCPFSVSQYYRRRRLCGQLISKRLFDVIISTKNPTKFKIDWSLEGRILHVTGVRQCAGKNWNGPSFT